MSRRIKRAMFAAEIIMDLFLEGPMKPAIVMRGLPPDSIFKGSYFDEKFGVYYIYVEHSSFDEIKPGEEIPYLEIHVQINSVADTEKER